MSLESLWQKVPETSTKTLYNHLLPKLYIDWTKMLMPSLNSTCKRTNISWSSACSSKTVALKLSSLSKESGTHFYKLLNSAPFLLLLNFILCMTGTVTPGLLSDLKMSQLPEAISQHLRYGANHLHPRPLQSSLDLLSTPWTHFSPWYKSGKKGIRHSSKNTLGQTAGLEF